MTPQSLFGPVCSRCGGRGHRHHEDKRCLVCPVSPVLYGEDDAFVCTACIRLVLADHGYDGVTSAVLRRLHAHHTAGPVPDCPLCHEVTA